MECEIISTLAVRNRARSPHRTAPHRTALAASEPTSAVTSRGAPWISTRQLAHRRRLPCPRITYSSCKHGRHPFRRHGSPTCTHPCRRFCCPAPISPLHTHRPRRCLFLRFRCRPRVSERELWRSHLALHLPRSHCRIRSLPLLLPPRTTQPVRTQLAQRRSKAVAHPLHRALVHPHHRLEAAQRQASRACQGKSRGASALPGRRTSPRPPIAIYSDV